MGMGNWIFNRDLNEKADYRVIFFHYAGGTASFYREWKSLFPENADICAVQLPMRANRINEPMPDSIEELVSDFINDCFYVFDRPFVLFGHSMGAQIAFEAAYRLQSAGITPRALFVSACEAPLFPGKSNDTVSSLEADEEDIIRTLKDYDYMGDSMILDDPEFRSYYIPIVRRDFYISEKYCKSKEAVLSCPIYVLSGRGDPFVKAELCSEWKSCTLTKCEFQQYSGDHFYLTSHKAAIADIIKKCFITGEERKYGKAV